MEDFAPGIFFILFIFLTIFINVVATIKGSRAGDKKSKGLGGFIEYIKEESKRQEEERKKAMARLLGKEVSVVQDKEEKSVLHYDPQMTSPTDPRIIDAGVAVRTFIFVAVIAFLVFYIFTFIL